MRRKLEDAVAGADARTRPRHANRTPTWNRDFRWRYFAWNWTVPVVVLATVVATTATLSSNSCCKSASFLTHFTSVLWKTVRREWYVS